MTSPATPIHDVIGVGFGPSNIALAIALEEQSQEHGKALDALFLDKQQNYRWHGDTLAEGSEMQISFLKDLVSLRNPTSPYSFVNYLHHHGRLVDFINLSTFYPSRMEFNDYLRWAAGHFEDKVVYNQEVLSIEPEFDGETINHLRVRSRDSSGREVVRRARSVVLSPGGSPRIPSVFKSYKDDARVFHHSRYLSGLSKLPLDSGKPLRIAVVGSGQSAAEALIDLHDSYPNVSVDMIMRASAMKPADDSPFVNEVFAPATTDYMFGLSAHEQQRLLEEYHNTNYSVVDPGLIERIYAVLYKQKVSNQHRHTLLPAQQIRSVTDTAGQLSLTLQNIRTGEEQSRQYDAVILATGYERTTHHTLLEPLQPYLNDMTVERDYRVISTPELKAAVYVQGCNEATHGLSDTLLSVLPVRSDEISKSLYKALKHGALHSPVRLETAVAS